MGSSRVEGVVGGGVVESRGAFTGLKLSLDCFNFEVLLRSEEAVMAMSGETGATLAGDFTGDLTDLVDLTGDLTDALEEDLVDPLLAVLERRPVFSLRVCICRRTAETGFVAALLTGRS